MNIYYTPEVNQQIKNILWKHANLYIDFRIATIEEDTQHATDMKIEMRGKSIALRMREPGCKYRDFTLRSRVASGNKTEIHKLRDGEGDIYLYGWLNHDRIIEEYIIVDIHELRATHIIDDDRTYISNHDGTYFFAYDIDIEVPLLYDGRQVCEVV